MKNETRVISEELEDKLTSTIIQFATKEGLTIKNIKEIMNKVTVYMEQNAIIEKDYHI
ncbi:hypothetical protein P4159_25855 [Bacillus thuringiensis]|uniref:hypothetical protein n=1 Tax=Bacillus cereus group TaxID=86661 RepID=UPI000279B3A2|nr:MULTISPECIES: hypothetical protein [Bacillus cereus group]EJR88136.1 hypothetical protein IKA_04122 [Bacillus cereus VD169]MEC3599084.1 hypothetical protein [Bacillus thuringiensis]MED1838096.1 hypothetical protein [Bacillus thuringiensis]MED2668329.1 hypothetical protein [Bacillus thuringiensis]MED2697602.1 hypothetical protein [Bacillus thuringiensis]